MGRAAQIERSGPSGADATRELYERFSGQIYGYCLHQLGSREEAEDAVQTTFMNAFRGLQRGIVPQVESAWLFKIAHNVCLSRRRSSWRRGKVEAPNNLEVLQEVVPARERIGDELIRLQDVLEKMPESQRRAILLREWQGLSYREIADELELSQAAVETLIFRARRTLATGLEEEQPSRRWRKRVRNGLDLGGLFGALKTFLSGGGAAKVAVTAAAVATTAAAVTSATPHRVTPAQNRHTGRSSQPARRAHEAVLPLVVGGPSVSVVGHSVATRPHGFHHLGAAGVRTVGTSPPDYTPVGPAQPVAAPATGPQVAPVSLPAAASPGAPARSPRVVRTPRRVTPPVVHRRNLPTRDRSVRPVFRPRLHMAQDERFANAPAQPLDTRQDRSLVVDRTGIKPDRSGAAQPEWTQAQPDRTAAQPDHGTAQPNRSGAAQPDAPTAVPDDRIAVSDQAADAADGDVEALVTQSAAPTARQHH